MNDKDPAIARTDLPVVRKSQLLANALLSECGVQQPVAAAANARATAVAERRSGISDLERAFAALAHAVQYLSSEQRAGRCTSVRGNRQAIALLCECAEELTKLEQREPALEAVNVWLAGARPS